MTSDDRGGAPLLHHFLVGWGKVFVASAIGTLLGGGLVLWLADLGSRERAVSEATAPVRTPANEPADATEFLRRLEERLAGLEKSRTRVDPEPAAAPLPAVGGSPPAERRGQDRIEELHARVAKLEALLATHGLPRAENADQLARQILSLASTDHETFMRNLPERLNLYEEFFQRYLDHPDTRKLVDRYLFDAIAAHQTARARDVLERIAPQLKLASWEREQLFLGIYNANSDRPQARRVHQAVMADPTAPRHVRDSAEFFCAYTSMEEGKLHEARALFEALIARLGNDPAAQQTVGGARTQIQSIDEQLALRARQAR